MGTVRCFASAGCSFIGVSFRTLPPTPLCRVRDRMSEYREIIYRDVCVSAVRCRPGRSAAPSMSPVVKSEKQKALVEVLVEVTERNFYNFE